MAVSASRAMDSAFRDAATEPAASSSVPWRLRPWFVLFVAMGKMVNGYFMANDVVSDMVNEMVIDY